MNIICLRYVYLSRNYCAKLLRCNKLWCRTKINHRGYCSLRRFRGYAVLFNGNTRDTSLEYQNVFDFSKLIHSSTNPCNLPSQVTASQMKNVLNMKEIEITDGYTCFIIKCPVCTSSKKNDMFINKVTGS